MCKFQEHQTSDGAASHLSVLPRTDSIEQPRCTRSCASCHARQIARMPARGNHRGCGDSNRLAPANKSWGSLADAVRIARALRTSVMLAVFTLFISIQAKAAQPTEAGFFVTPYVTGLSEPIAMEFAPDGRLFVAEKGGKVLIIQNGAAQDEPFATISVYSLFECGLLGLALDPNFADNHYIYFFATVTNEEQQILRYTEVDGIGTDPTVIRAGLPTQGSFHNGGCLRVGPDGKLYFSIGDNTRSENGQDLTTLAGKISRINLDGTTPNDNPFKTPTNQPRSAFALGFRNPFRFCFAPDGRLFVDDVGSDGDERREEVNLVHAGSNGGWPDAEGTANPDPAFIQPIYNYHDEGSAPTGIVYYTGTSFPAKYAGNLFHVDYVLNRVYRMILDGNTVLSHTVFVQGEDAPVDLAQGPNGELLYTELLGGRVMRITYGEPTDTPPIDVDDDEEPECNNLFGLFCCGTSAAQSVTMTMVLLSTVVGIRRLRRRRNK